MGVFNYQEGVFEFLVVGFKAREPFGSRSFESAFVFEKYSLIEEAIATYTEAMEVFPDSDFSYQLAKLYGEQGNLEKMFDSYLTLIKKNRSYLGVAQQNFSQYISENSKTSHL